MTRNQQTITTVSASLTVSDRARLAEYARSMGITQSTAVRQILREFLDNQESAQHIEWQLPLERRMKKLEDRMAALMAKLTRAAAQNLYFSTIPFTKGGLPNEPLPQRAFEKLWAESRHFASEWMKKATADRGDAGESSAE